MYTRRITRNDRATPWFVLGEALLLSLTTAVVLLAAGQALAAESCPAGLNHQFKRLQDGKSVSLCDYRGKVILVVNTASKCGFTPQFEGLERVFGRYEKQGLVVLGFPSADFGGQELESNAQIADFCRLTYAVDFPMFEKSSVRGEAANPLFQDLARRTGSPPRWNFHKYLIDRRGERVLAFGTRVNPESPELLAALEQMLAAPGGSTR